MEFLKLVRRRTFLSETLYVVLNIALVFAVLLLIRLTESPWLAIGLIVLSKWRVFAVRPRYWFVNVQSNLVDYIVGISFACFIYGTYASSVTVSEKTGLIAVLMALYIGWLLFVRTRSKRYYVVAQAAAALFCGTMLMFFMAYALPFFVVILGMWVLGYATGRHVLHTYDDEPYSSLLIHIWALTVAELSWLAYHWTVAYSFFSSSLIAIPRFAITMLCLGFVVFKIYDSYHHFGKVRTQDIVMPSIFTFGVIVVLPLVLSLIGVDIAIGI